MEKVQDQEQTTEVFENDIAMNLDIFREEQGIEDLKKESQSVWNGALRYIRKRVFPTTDSLKSKSNINIINNNIPSTFNAYDYDKVNDVCDIYIDLCFIYDKEVSILGFSNLTGIDTDTVNEWGNGKVTLSSQSTVIYKKLRDFREESLSNKLVTGKQNPVGVLGVLNRHYAWNMPGVRQDQGGKAYISADKPIMLGDGLANCTTSVLENTFDKMPESQ